MINLGWLLCWLRRAWRVSNGMEIPALQIHRTLPAHRHSERARRIRWRATRPHQRQHARSSSANHAHPRPWPLQHQADRHDRSEPSFNGPTTLVHISTGRCGNPELPDDGHPASTSVPRAIHSRHHRADTRRTLHLPVPRWLRSIRSNTRIYRLGGARAHRLRHRYHHQQRTSAQTCAIKLTLAHTHRSNGDPINKLVNGRIQSTRFPRRD